MRKLSLLLSVLVMSATSTMAQSEEEAVAMAVENLRVGMLNPDREALQSLTSPYLTYGHSSGTIENQEEFIDALVNGKYKFKRIDTSNQSIKIVDDIALVRHQLGIDVNDFTIDLGVLLVWKKADGQWKLLARQAFRINN